MSYRTVYDIAADGYDGWLFFAIAGGMLAVASVFLLLARRRGKPLKSAAPGFIITGIFFVVACVIPYADHFRLSQALQSGKASVVEGSVAGYAIQKHDASPSATKRDIRVWESFRVGDVAFQHLQGPLKNVPMRDGLTMRIHYVTDNGQRVEQRIVRAEVKE